MEGMMARIILTIADEMLAEVDAAAKREHRNRSELLREAVRHYLRGASHPAPAGATATTAAGMIEHLRRQALERAKTATDATSIIRSFRGPLVESEKESLPANSD
jgi:metal-responsive CopG/Arc/MetJ family transcriptional regulator